MTVSEDSASGNRRETAKASFIRMRQEWTEQVACDAKLTPTALRLAMLLSNGFNHETHETFVGRENLAGRLKVRPSLVSLAVGLLEERGHVAIRKVGRSNHYKMMIGSDLDSGQVRKSKPNRFVGPNTNRQGTDLGQGSGANAPASHNQGSPTEEGTRASEGARPSNEEAPLTSEEALEEIRRVYPGPSVDPAEDLATMLDALEEGVLHEKIVAAASSCGSTQVPLDDWLWRTFTQSGQAADRNESAWGAEDGAHGG